MSEREVEMNGSINSVYSCRDELIKFATARIRPRFRRRLVAEDVVENTIAHALHALAAGSLPVNLRSWLLDLLQKRIIDEIRRCSAQRRDVNREVSSDDSDQANVGLVQNLAADITSPSQSAIRNERLEMLRSKITQLPDKQREAITLKFIDGLTIPQIAEKMNSTEGTATGLLRRGTLRIAELMKPIRDQEGDSLP